MTMNAPDASAATAGRGWSRYSGELGLITNSSPCGTPSFAYLCPAMNPAGLSVVPVRQTTTKPSGVAATDGPSWGAVVYVLIRNSGPIGCANATRAQRTA